VLALALLLLWVIWIRRRRRRVPTKLLLFIGGEPMPQNLDATIDAVLSTEAEDADNFGEGATALTGITWGLTNVQGNFGALTNDPTNGWELGAGDVGATATVTVNATWTAPDDSFGVPAGTVIALQGQDEVTRVAHEPGAPTHLSISLTPIPPSE